MLSFEDASQKIHQFVEENLPLIRASQAKLIGYDEDFLSIQAPLVLNHNDHGTAFGGSIFNLALFAGWSSVYLASVDHIEKPAIVVRDAQIRYRHPFNEPDIIARCKQPLPRQWHTFIEHYKHTGKTSITMSSTLTSGETECARLEAVFVLLNKSQ